MPYDFALLATRLTSLALADATDAVGVNLACLASGAGGAGPPSTVLVSLVAVLDTI